MTSMGPLPEPEVLIKKVRAKGHGGHHGGAWKVAYADFVTAMMAFFLLMWLLGSTDEKKRQGIADYFSPTVVQMESSGGSNGVLGGRTIEEPDGMAPHARRPGLTPMSPSELGKDAQARAEAEAQAEKARQREVEREIRRRLNQDPGLKALQGQIRFVQTPEGLRIELIDKADYSMFGTGTPLMDPRAREMLGVVADVIDGLPNKLAIRGHTDATPFAEPRKAAGQNNWTLSSARAEATRAALADAGVDESRFSRLEGVAATDPYNPRDPFAPQNRRMSITLLTR